MSPGKQTSARGLDISYNMNLQWKAQANWDSYAQSTADPDQMVKEGDRKGRINKENSRQEIIAPRCAPMSRPAPYRTLLPRRWLE